VGDHDRRTGKLLGKFALKPQDTFPIAFRDIRPSKRGLSIVDEAEVVETLFGSVSLYAIIEVGPERTAQKPDTVSMWRSEAYWIIIGTFHTLS
jgi:hypothetical protein